jgi:hypothetical protein
VTGPSNNGGPCHAIRFTLEAAKVARVLGSNAVFNDPAAALMADGLVVGAAEETA